MAQNSPTTTRLTVSFQEEPLESILHTIAQQSGVSFSYNPRKIPVEQKITYSAEQKSVEEILNDLSAKVPFSYQTLEHQIVLQRARQTENAELNLATLSGYIRDAENGEVLIGATVIIEAMGVGAVTNTSGFYSLTLPKGEYEVSYSYIGFQKSVKTIDLTTSQNARIDLIHEAPVLEEIVVTSSPSTEIIKEVQLSKTNIRPILITERPALFGEMDAVKSLESLPGVKFHSDGSTFYYVRGGNRDQNLILLDDAPIYNPNHLLGLFSTLIPEAINDINFYKGSMPASLGGRLSSVMDVHTKQGNDQHFQASGNVGAISTKLSIEGPIKKDNSAFLLSGRVSRVKWFFHLANNDIKEFRFYDLTGKTNFKLNAQNKLFFSFYNGSDNYFTSTSGIEWANHTATLRWNHLFNNRLFLNTTLAGGSYDYNLYTDIATNTFWNTHISNVNLKGDFSYFINPQQEVTFGISLAGYNFNPGNLKTDIQNFKPPVVSVRNASEFVLYGNHEVKIGSHWGINYGLRLTSWVNEGPSFEFVYDANHVPVDTLFFKKGEQYKRYGKAEPRISISHFLSEKSSIKASFSRNIQNVHLISNSISPFTSLEVWLPSSINIKPQAANEMVLGYYRLLANLGISLEVEGFYKKMSNQIDYEAHAQTFLNPLVESELRFGSARAYGVEFMARKQNGRLRGLVGYSYSRAKRKFNAINNGMEYNAFYDRPNQVNLMLSYDLNLRWKLGMNWNYSTGAPFSSPVSFYLQNGLEVPIYGQKNNDRLPDYHRMDVSATLNLNKNPERKYNHSLTFSIYNVYGRKNPLFINYTKEEVDGSLKIPSNLLNRTQVSSQYYLFQFTPSISYNFKWQ